MERALRDRPDPEGCALEVDEADELLIREAKDAGEQARSLVRAELRLGGRSPATAGALVAAGAGSP